MYLCCSCSQDTTKPIQTATGASCVTQPRKMTSRCREKSRHASGVLASLAGVLAVLLTVTPVRAAVAEDLEDAQGEFLVAGAFAEGVTQLPDPGEIERAAGQAIRLEPHNPNGFDRLAFFNLLQA